MERIDYRVVGECLYRHTLPNGLHIQIASKPGYARRYAMFAVNYGGADLRFRLDGEDILTPAGVAHFLEHKLFDNPGGGSALTDLSGRGASPNAFTASDVTAYYFSCTDHFADNLRTLLSFVSQPWFTEESVKREQGIIAQEIAMSRDDPNRALYRNMVQGLYPRHPLANSILGTEESIGEITPDTLYACHRAFYRPANAVLCCVGDIDPEEVCRIAEEILPKDSQRAPELCRPGWSGSLPEERETIRTMPVAAPLFMTGIPVAMAASGKEQLRQQILGELTLRALTGSSSPFYTQLYARGLLSRNYGCALDCSAGASTAVIYGESAQPRQIQQEFADLLAKTGEIGIDPGLFNRVKKAYYGSELRGLGRFDGLARSMVTGHFAGWCPMDVFALLEDVTAEDCTGFVREHLQAFPYLSLVSPGGGHT